MADVQDGVRRPGWIPLVVVAAVVVGCAGAASVTQLAGPHPSGLVGRGAADAAKAAEQRFLDLQAMYRTKLLPEAQQAARSLVAAADRAALDVEGIDCLQWLAMQDVSFNVVTDYIAETPRRARDSCTIEQPIRLDSQVGAVRFSHDDMLMSCELARSIVRLSALLEARDVVEVDIATPFSCRTIQGRRRRVSQHAHGNALDVSAVRTASGQEFPIEDWERRDDTPETEGGRLWYELVAELRAQEVFRYILTPDYDRAHRHWLHLDITPSPGR